MLDTAVEAESVIHLFDSIRAPSAESKDSIDTLMLIPISFTEYASMGMTA